MTALAPTDSRLVNFRKELAKEYKGFEAVLPEGWTAERFARVSVNAITANPQLLECDRGSLFLALHNCAALGAEPNSPLHEIAIIPRRNRKKVGDDWVTVYEAGIQPEYRLWVRLAQNAGVSLQAGTIYEGDKVSYSYGANAHFSHEPAHPWSRKGAKVLGYYAYAELPDGKPVFLVWSKEEVEAHRDRYSDAYNHAESGEAKSGGGKKNSPWHLTPDRMGEKTMLIQLSRWLPKSVQRLAAVEGALDSGATVRTIEGGEIEIAGTVSGSDDETTIEKVVEEVAKATAEPSPDQEKFDRRRAELRATPKATPAETPTPAADSAEGDDEGGPPEGFGIQAGDAYRLGYDRETNAIQTRGMIEPVAITEETVRTNQGKGKEDPVCAWCGEVIHKGEQYREGRRGVKGCLRCFPEGPTEPEPEEDEPPPVPAGVGPSPEAREAVEAAPELRATKSPYISRDQLQALMATARSSIGENEFLIAVERKWKGIENVGEIPAEGFADAMRIALGE